ESGEVMSERGGRGGLTECFRIDRTGRIVDTQSQLVSREDNYTTRDRDSDVNPSPFFAGRRGYYDQRGNYDQRGYYDQRGNYYYRDERYPRAYVEPQQQYYGSRQQQTRDPYYSREWQTPQRVDPNYWGGR